MSMQVGGANFGIKWNYLMRNKQTCLARTTILLSGHNLHYKKYKKIYLRLKGNMSIIPNTRQPKPGDGRYQMTVQNEFL